MDIQGLYATFYNYFWCNWIPLECGCRSESLESSIFTGNRTRPNENRILNEPWTRNRIEFVWYRL